jgi:hypothetical protein
LHLPQVFGGRRLCFIAGKPYMVRGLSGEGWSHLLAVFDDQIPGAESRKHPPHFGSPECQEWLRTPEGEVLKIWLALQEFGIDYQQAEKLWIDASRDECSRLHSVLFAGRRTERIRRELEVDTDVGKDISETWCGNALAELARTISIEQLGRYTLAQIEWILSCGLSDQNPNESPEALQKIQDAMMAKWGPKLKDLKLPEQTQVELPRIVPQTVEDDLRSLGLRIKESDG